MGRFKYSKQHLTNAKENGKCNFISVGFCNCSFEFLWCVTISVTKGGLTWESVNPSQCSGELDTPLLFASRLNNRPISHLTEPPMYIRITMNSNTRHIKIICAVSIVICVLLIGIFVFLHTIWGNTNEPIRKYLLVETTNQKLNTGYPVVTNVPGGIGNQLFEFACVYSIARKRNSNVYVLKPPDNVSDAKHGTTTRQFSLNHFNIPFSKSVVEENFSAFGSGRIFDFKEYHIWEHSMPTDTVLRLNDVCVSELYFKEYREEIKEMLTLNIDERPIKDLLSKVDNTESVSVHVRRGDYLHSNENRSIPITFQKKTMKLMQHLLPNATFFVFSDDLDYVRKELREYENVIFVDNTGKPLESLLDFLIMSRCKHNIIANSTFSWWAAYLNRNKDKIVIGPSQRHPPGWNDLHYEHNSFRKYRELVFNYYMYPTDWLTLNPFEY